MLSLCIPVCGVQQVIGVFSMMPLLSREGLAVPCFVCTMLYVGLSLVRCDIPDLAGNPSTLPNFFHNTPVPMMSFTE